MLPNLNSDKLFLFKKILNWKTNFVNHQEKIYSMGKKNVLDWMVECFEKFPILLYNGSF